ncbi:sarcosine oxidase subunit gamma [Shimia gijangensis]|uniref:Sarcosine oxidase subunit gamma n=1 Tax=Shimia gijangensis TaxID=1470563 RepID=A0A1M6E6T7_9RHOB|nr:sarcosine oxidase subunit gamma family protein [Shimia gijangensis]SHI81089.1 sarcosine oxidase subunit gamma [Shimia gijangensis]
MSNAVSALNSASFEGFATVTETGLRGMITLRGDLSSAKLKAAVKAATGAAIPDVRRVTTGKDGMAAWMSPDELLILCDYASVNDTIATLTAKLTGEHALAVNVSDARAVFRIAGDGAREVLAKLAPVDLSAGAFQAGDFRRSRIAQVAAAFWLNDDNSFELVCFRSVAQYVFDVLKVSAQPGGEVGFL